MKRTVLILTAAILAAPLALIAQSNLISSTSGPANSDSSSLAAFEPIAEGGAGAQTVAQNRLSTGSAGSEGPVSKIGLGAGISPLGIQLQAVTNLGSHFNARLTGSFFNDSTNFNTEGISATGKLNLASVRASLDYYPFHAGFHISPGILLDNQNKVTATANVPAGSSFTLNDQTYYSANPNAATGATPVTGNGVLGLDADNPAFAITAGWGNTARGERHWSFPVEAGVAFVGAPTVKVNLAGWACYDEAQTQCTDISSPTNPIAIAIQSNLNQQISKWTSDLEPLKTYPIVSFGAAYSFRIR